MARAKVTHSDDAVQITFRGDKRNPEPATGVIKFPGGLVEVSRCTDGSYWAHIEVVEPENVADSRIDFRRDQGGPFIRIAEIPNGGKAYHIAVRVTNAVPHFDPDA